MPVVVVIGAQWGDEGKAHIVDLLAERARLVIRYGGGNNDGYTVINQHGDFTLHAIPSGIFDPATVNVIGGGVVLDPAVLLKDLKDLQAHNISLAKLFISERAHVVMPYHLLQDEYEKALRGDQLIGTCDKGVGPAYADKMARLGIRIGDLLHEETLLSRLRQVLEFKNKLFVAYYHAPPLSLHEIYLRYLDYGRQLADYVTDTHPIVQRALEKDVPVLLEGAQGALLDVDHGTYPYVTSTLPGAAGACQGAGIGPTAVHSVLGVFKAYTTRVGAGPFPTEVVGDAAVALHQIGKPWAEVVDNSGPTRRVGWFDAVLARYTACINGMDTMAITKLDVLDTLATIKICTGYRLHDTELDYPPANMTVLGQVEPIYEVLPGWRQPTGRARRFDQLPVEAQHYIARLCELTGVRLGMVSVGPDREQIIEVGQLF